VRQTNPDSTTDITPQPYKQTKILEKFSINIMGCYFSPILSLSFPQTFVPKGAQEVLKKTYSIVLNFPRFFPEKPKFFALK